MSESSSFSGVILISPRTGNAGEARGAGGAGVSQQLVLVMSCAARRNRKTQSVEIMQLIYKKKEMRKVEDEPINAAFH